MDKVVYDQIKRFFKELSAELKLRDFLEKKIVEGIGSVITANYSNNIKELSVVCDVRLSSEKAGSVMVDFKKDDKIMAQMPYRPRTNNIINNEFNTWCSVPYEILVDKITEVVDICKYL